MSSAKPKNPKPSSLFPEQRRDVLPTLFGDGYGLYKVRKGSFVFSFILNSSLLALLIWLGSWTASHAPQLKQSIGLTLPVDVSPYVVSNSKITSAGGSGHSGGNGRSGGGGGGGSHDIRPASKGALPKLAKTQIAPPTVHPLDKPKLPVAPTVVAPPDIKLPQSGPLGDPFSKVLGPASNGPGLGGGIGSGSGGGVGSGRGPGVGPGWGGGFGGGANQGGTGPYRVGGGVSAPRVIYKVDPEFSDEARRNKFQGVVVLRVVIGTDGRIHDIKVQRPLGMGLDEKAMAAARQWRFEPGKKDGRPVPVEVSMEISFHLY
ncbi:MAG: energy transducer TonB [Acidobacteria bacterium]|nr:MAG: energy transducer TonB [Acidobacteriota bacterium]